MAIPNRPITPSEHRNIANLSHILILEGLSTKTQWSIEDLVFQGGTSLSLAWNSSRFSEDLDFISRNDINLSVEIEKVREFVQDKLSEEYPGVLVDIKERESGQNNNFTFGVSLPNVLGKVKVKTEFWKVDPDLIKSYDGSIKEISHKGNIKAEIPTASLEQIFADKIVALGARPRLKWRDIFDVWYLDQCTDTSIINNSQTFLRNFENTLAMYNTPPAIIKDKWQELININDEELIEMASKDLKPWVNDQLWLQLEDKIPEMVSNLKRTLNEAITVFPPEEYLQLSSEEFRQKVRQKRAKEQENFEQKSDNALNFKFIKY